MAILGGASTLTGPIVGAVIITLVKNVVSTYVDRWNSLLGAIFVIVIMFMPFGIVPGVRQLWVRWQPRRQEARQIEQAARSGVRAMTPPALEVTSLQQALRRPAGDARRLAHRDAGRAAPDHRAERRRQDHAVQPGHRRPHAGRRLGEAVRAGAAENADAAARASRPRAHLSDPHAVSARRRCCHNVVLALLGLDPMRWNVVDHAHRPEPSLRRGARGAGAGRARRERGPHRRGDLLRRAAPARNGDGAGAEAEGAAARRAARRALARRSAARCASCSARCRATSPS